MPGARGAHAGQTADTARRIAMSRRREEYCTIEKGVDGRDVIPSPLILSQKDTM